MLDNPQKRSIAYQVLTILAILVLVYYGYQNVKYNLEARGILFGFDFLSTSAGFDIPLTLISYNESSTYLDVFFIGILNTLLVSVLGIIGATIVGFVFGVMSLSKNWLVSRLGIIYVEIFRNVPLLVQIIFWYEIILKPLPGPRDLYTTGETALFSLNNRGVYLPELHFSGDIVYPLVAFLFGVIISIYLFRWRRQKQLVTGEYPTLWPWFVLLLLALPIVTFIFSAPPIELLPARMGEFELEGGVSILPEFTALFLALVIYTGAFISEIVRSGIVAVPKGQTEAYSALGLRYGTGLYLVIIPQALRIIIPPLTNQYLNLTKNSSLAAAIAYPDLVAVFTGTVLNQSGRALEIFMMTLLVYLFISLLTSVFMNWFNKRVSLIEK